MPGGTRGTAGPAVCTKAAMRVFTEPARSWTPARWSPPETPGPGNSADSHCGPRLSSHPPDKPKEAGPWLGVIVPNELIVKVEGLSPIPTPGPIKAFP